MNLTPERYREVAEILEATADVAESLNELLGMRRLREAVVLLRQVAKGSDAAFRVGPDGYIERNLPLSRKGPIPFSEWGEGMGRGGLREGRHN